VKHIERLDAFPFSASERAQLKYSAPFGLCTSRMEPNGDSPEESNGN